MLYFSSFFFFSFFFNFKIILNNFQPFIISFIHIISAILIFPIFFCSVILGCGKSALVQAVSKKTNLPIIRVVPSVLLRKYVGDSSHMTKAIFTAAKKIQPCIIFIDEMDALFRARSDHEISYHNRELMTECTY